LSASEFAEQQEFAGRVRDLAARLPQRQGSAEIRAAAAHLAGAVANKAPAREVTAMTRTIAGQLVSVYRLRVTPSAAPPVARAATLFKENCAACHGAEGRGDGPAAARLNPPPIDFHDASRQTRRSVYGLYGTITLGVPDTAMRAFSELSDAQRWALAFYVTRFAAPRGAAAQGKALWCEGRFHDRFPDLAALTAVTPAEAAAEGGAKQVAVLAYLRQHPAAVAGDQGPVAAGVAKLRESVRDVRAGHRDAAYAAAVAAYLQGFEPMEPALDVVDHAFKEQAEARMGAFRNLVRSGADAATVAKEAGALELLLHEAAERTGNGGLSPIAGATSAFIILLREGVEAVLVLAAIIAFLVKTERRDALRWVHAGWISALALGGLTWFVADRYITISGANREMTEGVAALVAAVMLVYVGYWLHRNSNARAWKAFLHDKLNGALSGGSLWTLVAISFLAVYREVFETILFYETLWLQTAPGDQGWLVGGMAAGAAGLAVAIWAILRFSRRLPLRQFFSVNAVLLYVMAVVFAGKGVAAIQEAGHLPANPVPFPRIDLLGVYPNIESLGAQFLLLSLAAGWLLYSRTRARTQQEA